MNKICWIKFSSRQSQFTPTTSYQSKHWNISVTDCMQTHMINSFSSVLTLEMTSASSSGIWTPVLNVSMHARWQRWFNKASSWWWWCSAPGATLRVLCTGSWFLVVALWKNMYTEQLHCFVELIPITYQQEEGSSSAWQCSSSHIQNSLWKTYGIQGSFSALPTLPSWPCILRL